MKRELLFIMAAGLAGLALLKKDTGAPGPSTWDAYFAAYSQRPDWAKAVAKVESSFDPKAAGTAGELGLMQIKPSTAGDLGFYGDAAGLLDPRVNIYYGARYLDMMIDRFGRDVGIQAYNVGPGAASRGTRNVYYLEKVYNAHRTISLVGWDPVISF